MITTPDGRPDKYAQIERERRYLLRGLPAVLQGSGDYVRIVDRYLPESALRLRRMERPNGAPRTLAVCALLVDDREAMVVKALSWALRSAVGHDPAAVEAFVAAHDDRLAARVRREVRNKLTTGRKNR